MCVDAQVCDTLTCVTYHIQRNSQIGKHRGGWIISVRIFFWWLLSWLRIISGFFRKELKLLPSPITLTNDITWHYCLSSSLDSNSMKAVIFFFNYSKNAYQKIYLFNTFYHMKYTIIVVNYRYNAVQKVSRGYWSASFKLYTCGFMTAHLPLSSSPW